MLIPRLLPSWRSSSTIRGGPHAWLPTTGEPSAANDFWWGETDVEAIVVDATEGVGVTGTNEAELEADPVCPAVLKEKYLVCPTNMEIDWHFRTLNFV